MEKQIEEMAGDLCACHVEVSNGVGGVYTDYDETASRMVAKGYRKQVEGEWHWISDYDVMCTTCGRVFNSNDNADAGLSSWRFCPYCGAKMKGE